MAKANIGLQLYTLRDDMAADFEGTLRQVAALGYKGVEFAGYFGKSAAEIRKLLDELNLKAIGSHISLDRLKENLQGEIDFLKAIGGSHITCPWMPTGDRANEQGWKSAFAYLQATGETVRKQGLVFSYHNHEFEFQEQVDGVFAFDALYAAADAVQVELDVCWVQFAGQDPLAYIRKYAGRLPLLHLKDFGRNAEGKIVTLELGQGDVALTDVIRTAIEAGVEWFIVEQDSCQNPPLTSIANSMNWLKRNQIV